MNKKIISVVTPTFNEDGNVEEVYRQVKDVFAALTAYDYHHIFIDNASTDGTQAALRRLASEDQKVKVIFNNRNFGAIRSHFHGIIQGQGDAVICLCSDLQDPPHLINEFLKLWEEGHLVVVGQKNQSAESALMFMMRTAYYRLVRRLSGLEMLEHVTGFGLYDRKVVEQFRTLDDPYPYMRGLITELGYHAARVQYHQPLRKRGITSTNFYILYDTAMLGITSHSKIPLRLATMTGFLMAFLSFLVAVGYLAYKLLFWYTFSAGMAPVVIGLFFFSSVQLFFIGILGEYIGAIHTQALHRPMVVEKERINF